MSVGDGLLWSTIVIVAFASIWLISRAHKWRLVGKVLLVMVALCGVIGGGVWGWFWYQDRPRVMTALAGIELGMSPLEVKVAKGEPERSLGDGTDSQRMLYSSGGDTTAIIFDRDGSDELGVSIVCSTTVYDKIFGLGPYTRESKVKEKLGDPAETSIDKRGLAKLISYPKWRVAFEIEKGSVTKTCITASGYVRFVDEYKDS